MTCKSVSQTTTVQSIACRQSFLHSSTSMHSMLCYRRWKCIRRSSTTVTTSSEPSLSCGSNAAVACCSAAEPPKTALDAYTACNASLYPNLSILLQMLDTLPVTTATAERSFSTQTVKDIPSVVNGRRAADMIGADPRTCPNDANRTCRSR